MCVARLDFIACARRAREIRLHGENISSDAHTHGAFNMLLLFAFRFCYASSRAAFCIRRMQTFDVRMNGHFRATPSRSGLMFMRITFIEVRSTASGCLRAVVWINMKFSINCAVFFEKFRNSSEMRQLNQMGSGRRSAIQLEQKFARSLCLRISQLGYPIL